ncbi:MAG: ABC transporter ATP-binding protein [Actinomycetota bacterium]|nr:ABC transporter ATP-binding protein [Actinomycetota bacterium]MDA8207689.1 ABC transporter ATP-binding protein [Actinomycetota bacterium]
MAGTAGRRGAGAASLDAAAALAVEDLSLSIAGSRILDGVSFTVAKGGVTALIGRNGAGKTTTLRSVIGLEHATGSVRVAGVEVAGWPTFRRIRFGIGYVPEDRDVFSHLTVKENLQLAESGTNPRYDLVYQIFPELAQRSQQAAGTLSGGQQQMLAIARVLLNDKGLLLIDEPSKGLSPRFVGEMVEALEKVRGEATVVLVEQNIHVVKRLAGELVILDQGRVAHAGPVEDLDDPELVRRLLGVSTGT